MPEFVYKALRANGEMIHGLLAAESEAAVLAELRQKQLLPLQVSTPKEARGSLLRSLLRKKPTSQDRLALTQQLGTLVGAGIPLDRSLALCRDLAEKEDLRALVQVAWKELRSGKSLADSLAACGSFFPPIYSAMVRAGEASGTLPAVLERLAEFEQFNEELRNYLISALIYPTLLLTVGGLAIGLLLGFVVPRFAQVFQESGVPLPFPTWLLLQIAQGFRHYAWIAALGLILAFWAGMRWVRTEPGRARWDSWKLRVPLVGSVWLKLEIGRFAKTLGTLLSQAVPILSALRLTREVLRNRVLAAAVDPIMQGVKRGAGLAEPMAQAGVFPPLAVQLAKIGEQTGRLDAMLLELSAMYDQEVRRATKRLVALVEPAVILVMGVIVGAIVISTLLAIVSVNEVPF
jgi:general secretion pathway protein F